MKQSILGFLEKRRAMLGFQGRVAGGLTGGWGDSRGSNGHKHSQRYLIT